MEINLLQTMGLNKNFQDTDGYMDIEVKEGKTSSKDVTEVSTFTTEILPLADEKCLDTPFQKSGFYPS